MAYNDSTTIGELRNLRARIFEDHDIFEIGKRELAIVFLRELLELDTTATAVEIETSYKAKTHRTEVPPDSERFWKFVEEEYLELSSEPNTRFSELAFRAHYDLVSVSAHLKYIETELVRLGEKKRVDGRLSAEDRYYRNQLEYFEAKNRAAKEEIVDFMTHRIKRAAIARSAPTPSAFLSLGSSLFGNSPYAFGRRSHWLPADPYDVRALDEYSNKFMDLPVSSWREFVDDCKRSPEQFKRRATEYITGIPDELPGVREKLERLIEKSHILASRKEVIRTMLRHFAAKDYLSFVSMAPLQVEGIFADICRSVGVSEGQLDISSLNDKLQHIEGKMPSFFFFEYYSFKFPVLRNLVAHGGLVDGELEVIAIRLMLDLLPVCELAISKDLPIMHALEVVKLASRGDRKSLVEWLDLRQNIAIPEFYAAAGAIVSAEARYATQEFWEYLHGELTKINDLDQIKGSNPVKIAGMLKTSGLAVEQAETFLKSSGRVAAAAIKSRNEKREMLLKAIGKA